MLEFAYNKRPHTVTDLFPFEMNYGKSPITLYTIGTPKKFPSVVEFLERVQVSLHFSKNDKV